MRRTSAGLLLYRRSTGLQVLLGHMGGPYWLRKDEGAWSIPKGEYGPDEEPFHAATREFAEELGTAAPQTRWLGLGTIAVSKIKDVMVWAGEADFDTRTVISNSFVAEWPRGSGNLASFPEIDRAGWFDIEVARVKLVKGQAGFLDRLLGALSQET